MRNYMEFINDVNEFCQDVKIHGKYKSLDEIKDVAFELIEVKKIEKNELAYIIGQMLWEISTCDSIDCFDTVMNDLYQFVNTIIDYE